MQSVASPVLSTSLYFVVFGGAIDAGGRRVARFGEASVARTVDGAPVAMAPGGFAQANAALEFDRAAAHGQHLDVPAGTAVRFEPGIEREVTLVPLAGTRVVAGLTLPAPGALDGPPATDGDGD